MVRTRSSTAVKAGGKAPRKSTAQQGSSTSSSDGAASSKKSNGSGNPVNAQPTPAWQKKVTDFLSEPPSKKMKGEVEISAGEDVGGVSGNGSAEGMNKNGSVCVDEDVPIKSLGGSDISGSNDVVELPKLTAPGDGECNAPDKNAVPECDVQLENSADDDKSDADGDHSANGSNEEIGGEPQDDPDRGDGDNEEGAAADNPNPNPNGENGNGNGGGGDAGNAGFAGNPEHIGDGDHAML